MVFPVGTSPGSRPSSIERTGALVFAMFRCVRLKSKEFFSSLRREGALLYSSERCCPLFRDGMGCCELRPFSANTIR